MLGVGPCTCVQSIMCILFSWCAQARLHQWSSTILRDPVLKQLCVCMCVHVGSEVSCNNAGVQTNVAVYLHVYMVTAPLLCTMTTPSHQPTMYPTSMLITGGAEGTDGAELTPIYPTITKKNTNNDTYLRRWRLDI